MAHIPRLYVPGRIGPGPLTLVSESARRLTAVMRMRPGDPFTVFCGDGREWSATVSVVEKNRLQAQVDEVTRTAPPLPVVIECWCGLIRPNRMDWAVEKCTEAGVDIFRPLVSEHGARGEAVSGNREERWQRIAIEAAEQSGRLSIPVFAPPGKFEQLIDQPIGALVLFDREGKPWQETVPLVPEQGRVTVAVGPEGGFSAEEVAVARARGALVVSLGPNILRTETAAVAGVVLLRSLGQ